MKEKLARNNGYWWSGEDDDDESIIVVLDDSYNNFLIKNFSLALLLGIIKICRILCSYTILLYKVVKSTQKSWSWWS